MKIDLEHNVEVYNLAAEYYFDLYEDVAFEFIHSDVLSIFDTEKVLDVLDVGCGSGRDAMGISKYGHSVLGVDPSINILQLAKSYHGDVISWLDDSLPRLSKVQSLRKKFDVILVSAVWMHLPEKTQKESLKTLIALLNVGGKIIISWRNIAQESKRRFFSVDPVQFGECLISHSSDCLLRPRSEVLWSTVVISA
jgi:2-polyprenyl-3-methyl-5-hydroxy-6-metoxy-1,4-benzoquinol methylase